MYKVVKDDRKKEMPLSQLQLALSPVSIEYTSENLSKGKGLPTTGHEGQEGEQRYSSTLTLTSAIDGGGWSTPSPGRFTPGNDPVLIVQEAEWAPGPIWTGVENLDSTGIRSPHRPARSVVAIPTELPRPTNLTYNNY